MMQSTSYSDADGDDAFFGYPFDALAVGVDQPYARRIESLQIFVMEARTLAELAIPGLELLCCFAILHDGVDPRANFLHLFEIGVFECGQHLLGVNSPRGMSFILERIRCDKSVQPS